METRALVVFGEELTYAGQVAQTNAKLQLAFELVQMACDELDGEAKGHAQAASEALFCAGWSQAHDHGQSLRQRSTK